MDSIPALILPKTYNDSLLSIKKIPGRLKSCPQWSIGEGSGLTEVLTPPLSDWEAVGVNPTADRRRMGFFIQGRNSNGFP